MRKIVKLTEQDLISIVKRVISESQQGIEVQLSDVGLGLEFRFEPGSAIPKTYWSTEDVGTGNPQEPDRQENSSERPFTQKDSNLINSNILGLFDMDLKSRASIRFELTRQQLKMNPQEKFIRIWVPAGISQRPYAPKPESKPVVEQRKKFIIDALKKFLTSVGIDHKYITTNSTIDIRESNYDRGGFRVYPWIERGLKQKGIQDIQKSLNKAATNYWPSTQWIYDDIKEEDIVYAIKKLETFSDIRDLNDSIEAGGKYENLDDFLNSQLEKYPNELETVANLLKNITRRSGKQSDTIRYDKKRNTINIGIGE